MAGILCCFTDCFYGTKRSESCRGMPFTKASYCCTLQTADFSCNAWKGICDCRHCCPCEKKDFDQLRKKNQLDWRDITQGKPMEARKFHKSEDEYNMWIGTVFCPCCFCTKCGCQFETENCVTYPCAMTYISDSCKCSIPMCSCIRKNEENTE